MSNIPRTPPHENRSNMSGEHDDQDIELIEHQQFNRGAGLQTYVSTKKNAWGDNYSPQSWSSLVK